MAKNVYERWLKKDDCEKRLKHRYPNLYNLIGIDWWHDQSPLRKWVTYYDRGYDVPIRIFERQLSIINHLFPGKFATWKGTLSNLDHFWSKIYEARCIEMLNMAGIRIVDIEQDNGTGRKPDLCLEVSEKYVTVECTSLHYDPPVTRDFLNKLELEEDFRMRFSTILRPYYIVLNWMPNLEDEDATNRFFAFFEEWFATHQDGENAEIIQIQGFEGVRILESPMAHINYCEQLPYVLVGGQTSAPRLMTGFPNTLKNSLNAKRKQLMNQSSAIKIIAVDISFRSDLLINNVVSPTYISGMPLDVKEMFNQENAQHVHAVHISQLNIFDTAPVTPMSWVNPHAQSCDQDVLNLVLSALSWNNKSVSPDQGKS